MTVPEPLDGHDPAVQGGPVHSGPVQGVVDEEWTGAIADMPDPQPIISSDLAFSGRIWSVRRDVVDVHGHQATRDVQLHPGAVAVIALDHDDQVLLIRQYRHPVGMRLFEPPAGLLDHPGEDPLATAERELAEEAGYRADRWDVLVDLFNSPGGSSEAIRVYLARGLSPLDGGRVVTGEAEELHLPRAWVPLEQARDLVLAGRIASPSAVCGILAAWVARADDWRALRDAHATWPIREAVVGHDRLPPTGR